MMGLIPEVMRDLLSDRRRGRDVYEEVCRHADLSPVAAYRLDTDYEDGHVRGMFRAAESVLGLTEEQLFDVYAKAFIDDALNRFPVFFEMSRDSKEFLIRQPSIHNCLAASIADRQTRARIGEKFEIEHLNDGIITHYRSPNRMAGLYVALAKAVIAHYGDDATLKPLDDLHGAECRIEIVWQRLGGE